MEEDLGQVAGVSDRGLRHSRNEDAMHFAVADTDGRYRLEGIRAGRRRVTAWNEAKGTQDREVVVPAGGTVELNFETKK